MQFRILLLVLFFTTAACTPSQQEIEKQEAEYDRIADSVLKNSMPVDTVKVQNSTDLLK